MKRQGLIDKEFCKEDKYFSEEKQNAKKIELLVPAGDIEKARVAILYGASAIYLAGKSFGLRSSSANFCISELKEIIRYAKERKVKVYLVLNSYLYNADIELVREYLLEIKGFGLDGIIVSDIGVFSLVKEYTNYDIHISTQASSSSISSISFWKSLGAKRVVLAREVSLKEAIEIKYACDIELEIFVHGSMCMAYSGKCVISNYTAFRDANKGGCTQSCRWKYDVIESVDDGSDGNEDMLSCYPMNSKDLLGLDYVYDIINSGIESIKIEGRSKSLMYLAFVVSLYRSLINNYYANNTNPETIDTLSSNLMQTSSRDFTTAFINDINNSYSVSYDNNRSSVPSNFVGIVRELIEEFIVLEVKNNISVGDRLACLLFSGSTVYFNVNLILDMTYSKIDKAPPNSLVLLEKPDFNIEVFNIIYNL